MPNPNEVKIEPEAEDDLLKCPFCWDSGFDLLGLKLHLENGWCERYEELDTNGIE